MRYISICLLCVLLCLSFACQSSTKTRSGDRPVIVDLDTLCFDTLSVSGQVQVKAHRNAPWRTLRAGETFNGYAFVRTGFDSNVDLVMQEDARTIRCTLGSLLCCTSIRDIYSKVLCCEGLEDYKLRLWGAGEYVDPESTVIINRALLCAEDPVSLLSEAIEANSLEELMKSTTTAAGAGASSGCPT